MADTSRKITSREYQALGEGRELLEREWPPCRSACPVHADVRAYLELIARGRFAEALDVIREVLPFPGVCGRICHHPCEQECRRNDVDQPAAIRDLKRFVAEFDYPGPRRSPPRAEQQLEKVAVIGAGPSGLACALDLARLGYRPTVYDRNAAGGGLLRTAVPTYRLPRKVLDADVDSILAGGVEFRGGVDVGKDVKLAALRDEGFKAVVLAVGLSTSRGLAIPGADARGVDLALPFLARTNENWRLEVGADVVVIGGGNVAVDVARSAVRCGARRVRMACLENEQEQPAWVWERREALEENISTVHRVGPKRVLVRDGRACGVEFRAVTRVFDASGRFSPQYDEASPTTLECDTVVFAVGQGADLALLAGSDVKADERGRLVWSRETARTSAPDVFACGEVVTGPGSAVEAVASGHRAAKAVDAFLRGRPIDLAERLPGKVGEIDPKVVAKLLKADRPAMPTVAPAERVGNFEQFELGLDEAAAMSEARRCMSCAAGPYVISDKCAACLTCRRVCPFEIPVVTEVAEISSALCQGCGICAAECPANAIVMAGYGPDAVRQEVGAALAVLMPDRLRIVVFSCGHHAPAARWGQAEAARPAAVAKEIFLPSMSRLGADDIVQAFEAGADGVAVLECASGACRYPSVAERLRKRVELARGLLVEAGFDAGRLRLAVGGAQDPAAASMAVAQVAESAARQTRKQL